jgi:hypothetical protein
VELLTGIPGESDLILPILARNFYIIVGSLCACNGSSLKSSLCLCKNSFQGAYTEGMIVILIIMPFKIGLFFLLFKCWYESLLEIEQVPDSSLDCVSPNQMRNS